MIFFKFTLLEKSVPIFRILISKHSILKKNFLWTLWHLNETFYAFYLSPALHNKQRRKNFFFKKFSNRKCLDYLLTKFSIKLLEDKAIELVLSFHNHKMRTSELIKKIWDYSLKKNFTKINIWNVYFKNIH
jgi:predicted PolB exonuclease-like 3'-5' exonuclease